ncbi:MAG: FGGY-family carbohydrate kinase [Acuticoccus sp.]
MYFATADGGTESLRARIYDAEGRAVGNGVAAYETAFAAGGRAEQNPEDWWRALGEAMRAAVAEARIDPADIATLACDTTCCTVVALDEEGHALRPAILWMDVRAAAEADAVMATGDPALAINAAGRGPLSAEWMIPKALWIARHEPDVFARAATICEYQDFFTLRLTGRRVASLSNIAARWHYRTRAGGWPTSLLKALDLDALADKWPSEIAAAGDVIDTLTPAAATHLGLTPKTRLVQGGVDALIGVVGLGVHKPGDLALITGSSHLQYGMAPASFTAPGLWGTYADALYRDSHVVEGGQASTGSTIQWLGRLMNGTMDLAALNAAAAQLEPGCDGLLVQDHFQGNRTPHTDSRSRGALVGLSLAHGPQHVFRAVMEGVGFGTRATLDAMVEAGFTPTRMTIGGGAVASPLWVQIHADTSGLPVVITEAREAPNLGCAVLAAHGAGAFASIEEGIASFVKPARVVEPRPREQALYEEIYQRYRALYPALRPLTA